MKKQTAGVLLRTGDAISETSATVLLGNQASFHTEKDLLLEWLAAKEYVRQVEHALFEANQKEVNLRVAVHDLVLQKALLTKREREVFDAIMQHQRNKEIAWELHISERTVKFHVSVLLRKLGKRSRHELIFENAAPKATLTNQKEGDNPL